MFHKFLLIIIFLTLFLDRTSAQSSGRENFDRGWQFHLGDLVGAEQVQYDDRSWRVLDLPHDWSIEGSFKPDNPTTNSSASLPAGIGWYRKHFTIQSMDQRCRTIRFDGVYMNSTVWINGHLLGNRPYGYSTFEYNLTPYLQVGENTLAVKVDNSLQPNSRWYSGSGIYRHVWLTTSDEIHFGSWGPYVTTPKVSAHEASIQASTPLTNDSKNRVKWRLISTVLDETGKEVTHSEVVGTLNQGVSTEVASSLKVMNPNRWNTEQPHLYQLKSELWTGKTLRETYLTTFGIRKLQFRSDSGLFVNDLPVKVKGVCMHHDLGCLGTAINSRALTRQLAILKEMGCNGIRTSHNPPSPELLDLCDRMGFLVMDEAFDVWKLEKVKYDYHLYFPGWHERDLADMVQRDRNHPSVFLWSVGNEIPEKNHTKYGGAAITKELDGIIKQYDKTRYTTLAFAGVWRGDTTFMTDKVDVIGINYTVERYPEEKAKHPHGFFIASETTSSLSDRGVYHFPADSAIGLTPDMHCSAFDNRGTYYDRPATMISQTTWKIISQTPYVAGLFIWTGFDYFGEPAYPYPCISSGFGIFDLCGFPKDIYYMYKSQWKKEPVLHLLPHWNWKEGAPIDVVAYTNCDEVRLFLNDQPVGEPKFTNDSITYWTNQWDKKIDLGKGTRLSLMWKVPFKPGVLRAEGYKNGKHIATDIVRTAGDPARIELTADRTSIAADGSDLSFFTIRILDQNGTLVPNADNLVFFEVEGEGTIAGVANGDPISLEPAKGRQRRAFNGMCQVVVQSTRIPGKIVLKASSLGLPAEKIILNSH